MTLADAERRAENISTMDYVTVGEKQGFFRGSASSIADIWRHRELLGLLVRREIKTRYKDSSLGIVWSLLRPLVQLAIYYFAVGQILGAARSVPDFAIFIFIGITMWGLFNEILNNSTTSILNNSGLVKKVYLPREIFPFSTVGGALFNFAMQVIVLLAAILVLSTFPLGPNLLLAPLAILSLVAFATAIGLILSAVNVYFRDVQHLVEIATIILFWASPIVYSFTFVHKALNGNWLEQVYLMNPVTTSVLGMQKALWAEGSTATGALQQYWPPNLELRLVVTFLVSLALLWLAQRIFARLQGNFAQEL